MAGGRVVGPSWLIRDLPSLNLMLLWSAGEARAMTVKCKGSTAEKSKDDNGTATALQATGGTTAGKASI